MKTIEVVGAAIIQGKKVLAAQRSQKMKEPLKWEFPGGKVETGESRADALVRELSEELDIDIIVKSILAEGFSRNSERVIALYVYETEILRGSPKAREHEQLQWVPIAEIMELDWAEADLPACRELLRRYSQLT